MQKQGLEGFALGLAVFSPVVAAARSRKSEPFAFSARRAPRGVTRL